MKYLVLLLALVSTSALACQGGFVEFTHYSSFTEGAPFNDKKEDITNFVGGGYRWKVGKGHYFDLGAGYNKDIDIKDNSPWQALFRYQYFFNEGK
jgi:hypothetical protein